MRVLLDRQVYLKGWRVGSGIGKGSGYLKGGMVIIK